MSNPLISAANKPVAFLSVSDRVRAKNFYSSQLGLQVLYEDDFALVYNLGLMSLRISEIATFQPQPFTVLGWEVTDIVSSAKQLAAKGIKTKRFDSLEQDELGIWCSPSTAVRIVWFEDPDGNLLSLSDPVV